MTATKCRTARLATAAASALILVSCTGSTETGADPVEETPHGYVEGAEETAEPQTRLIVADSDSGAFRVVDLISEDVTELGAVAGVGAIAGDGRYGYLSTAEAVHIVDSGSWTVEHGDHVHCYRSEPRDVGVVRGREFTAAYSDATVTALSFSDGSVVVLDRKQLDKGTVAETTRIAGQPHDAVAVPYEEHVLTSVADEDQRSARGIEIRTRDGRPAATISEPCPALQGTAVTRRGVVFGCADGALLITEEEGTFHGEKIPYLRPVGAAERAKEFSNRPESATLAAKAGSTGVWVLDVSNRTWSRRDTGPTIAVNAVGEGAPVLTLTADGVLHALDPESGEQIARTALLWPGTATASPAPSIHVDTARAYVNNPSGGELYEIDYNDHLRQARTLTVEGKAGYIVETGR